MTYYPDLSPYSYGELPYPCDCPVNIGWLEPEFDHAQGPVPEDFVARLRFLSKKPLNLTRGWHFCGLCIAELKDASGPEVNGNHIYNILRERGGLGNGEIVVMDRLAGACFVSPAMILHYVERHEYSPPSGYVDAVNRSVSWQGITG